MSNDIRTLIINEGSEFKIKVEKLVDFNKSFFKDIYDSAAVNVKEILDNTQEYYDKKKKKEFFKDKEEANNIIAFTGERGTGKSSVMISFAESLKTVENDSNDLDKVAFEKFIELKEVSFVNLDIIDPALLDDKESIFEIVIAKMFSKFKEYLEKEDGKLEFDDKKRLLKKFQKVYKDLKVINTDRKDFFKDGADGEDILQTLVSLASGSNMRKSFIELVNEYLRFFSNDNNKDRDNDREQRFLVIPIDDLDMDIKHSAEMAEQIRKYLMVPNVIILMAIKIEQLKDSMEQMYRNNYEVMLESGSLSDDPKEMAERYIEKLIPNGRKLYLPEIRAISYGKKEKIILVFKSKDNCKSDVTEFEDIEDVVLGMTYRKTGLIFIKPTYYMNYLVPDNLRELQNYLIMLNKMKDVDLNSKGEESSDDIRIKNIEKFETYFLNIWIKRNLPKQHIELLEELYNTTIDDKNKFIITSLNKIIIEELEYKVKVEKWGEIKKSASFVDDLIKDYIFDIKNSPLNVSIGDVLKSLEVYKDLDTERIKKLKFAIKTTYSILVFKLLYTEDNSISVLLGGNIFSDLGGPKILLDLKNYPDIMINNEMSASNIVKESVDKILDTMQEENIYINDDSELKNNIKLLELLNYFIYITPDDMKPNYRILREAYYDIISNLGCGQIEVKNAKFDMLAFVFFLISPIKNLEKIFLGAIENKLENKEYFKKDKSKITKSDLLNEIKNYSMVNTVEVWKKQYKVALPIYSLDILENIGDRLKKIAENKFKKGIKIKESDIQYYNRRFKRMFTAVLPEIIDDIKEDNKFLFHKKEDGIKVCLFEEAYYKCPIVELVRGTMYCLSNKEISENNLFESTVNNAYIKSEQAKENLKPTHDKNKIPMETYKIVLESLNNNKNYFSKWSKRIVSAYRVIEEIKQVFVVKEYLSIDAISKFFNLKEQLDGIKKDNSKESETIRIEIVQIGLHTLQYEINRIEEILKKMGSGF
ncbi:KAP family NTPase [Clostridium estertheticum]|uniref:KAP family NTPase n=1 Tax=Clostridium estertheticum TaxID=238834 RepID=UPI001C0B3868|nr:KAP family NTPase [Clostridium estertheticum]MBU3178428.1 KAP family NTPase [Clostridium estertheticum]